MVKYRVFDENKLAYMITCTVLNRYDFYIIIDANRGVGKSSLAFRLAKCISRIFRRLYKGDIDLIVDIFNRLKTKRKELTMDDFIAHLVKLKKERAYIFNAEEDLIYDQESAKSFLQGWYGIGVFDEFINIGFSRDFFDKSQKDLIKMINLNRDHSHVILACVPHFSTIDNQLRNLSKMRIFLKERGLGVIMQPNKGMAIRDKWDMDYNEKQERKWMERNIRNPRWERLTTFRGIIKTRPLSEEDEALYQKIKNDKRAVIVADQMNVKSPKERMKERYDEIIDKLKGFKIKSFDEINGYAQGMGISPDTLKNNIKKMLKDEGASTKLDIYFFDEESARKKIKENKSKLFTLSTTTADEEIMNL